MSALPWEGPLTVDRLDNADQAATPWDRDVVARWRRDGIPNDARTVWHALGIMFRLDVLADELMAGES